MSTTITRLWLLLLFLVASVIGVVLVVRAGAVSVNLTSTYQYNGSVSVWGDTELISLVYEYPGFASVWRDTVAPSYVYTYTGRGSAYQYFLYIEWRDNATGLPVCFPFRPCVVEFALPGVTSNATIVVDNSTHFFSNVVDNVIEGSFLFTHRAWSNATLHVIPDGNESAAFNYTIPLYLSTAVKRIDYTVSSTGITFNVLVVFKDYPDIPAANETVLVLLNNATYAQEIVGPNGYVNITIPLSQVPNGTSVCFKPVHGLEGCATITYQGPSPTVTVSLPTLNYTIPNLTFPRLSPTVPGLTTVSDILASFAFLALFIWLSDKVTYTYALVVTGAVMAGYGSSIRVAFGSSPGAAAMVVGGIIAIIAGFLLEYIRG